MVTEADDQSCNKAATGNDDVEEVPSVGSEAAPPKAKATNEYINQINGHDGEKEVI